MGGGAPLFLPPAYPMAQAPGGYPPGAYPPGAYPPGVASRPQPRQQPRPPQPQQAAVPPPTVRGVRPEEPARPARVRTALAIPTPEELGVAARAPAPAPRRVAEEVDWTATRRRLQELGAVRFQLEHLAAGGM